MGVSGKVILGDSRNMQEVGDESIALVVTSPPYWHLKDYGVRIRQMALLNSTTSSSSFFENPEYLLPGKWDDLKSGFGAWSEWYRI